MQLILLYSNYWYDLGVYPSILLNYRDTSPNQEEGTRGDNGQLFHFPCVLAEMDKITGLSFFMHTSQSEWEIQHA